MKHNQQKLPRFSSFYLSFVAVVVACLSLSPFQAQSSTSAASTLPTVTIIGTDTNASELLPMMSAIDAAYFQIKRTGSTQNALEIKFEIGGTATNGIDFKRLNGIATIPAGKPDVLVEIAPIADSESEPTETVVLSLKTGTGYNLGTPKSATVYIQNRDWTNPASSAKISITKPANLTKFKAPAEITIEAEAVDPNGYISSMEFYDNAEKIGESKLYFFVAPKPGTVITHTLTWKKASIGIHKIYAKSTDSKGITVQSAAIEVSVVESVALPGVNVMATDPSASENKTNYGIFTFTKFGMLNTELKVNYTVSGTASNGVDYIALPGQIIIPSGKLFADLTVTAIDDTLRETNETVIVTIKRSEFYSVLYSSNAVVTIEDNDTVIANQPPVVSIVRPNNNATLINPTNLLIVVEAKDKETHVSQLEFLLNEKSLGKLSFLTAPKTNVFEFNWLTPSVGDYTLIAKATDSQGLSTLSAPIKISIKSAAAKLTIENPLTGAKYKAPANVIIDALAIDPAGAITKVNFYNGDKQIGSSQVMFVKQPTPGTPIKHSFAWTNVPIGSYSLTAQALNAAGKQVVSPVVSISVTGTVSRVLAERILPETYTAGTPLTVKMKVSIPASTSFIVYAIEEKPPTGWIVTDISEKGIWDTSSGKIKWGPFLEGASRVLYYSVTPAKTSVGTQEFSGKISLDGVSSSIGGASTIKKLSLVYHPADKSPANWIISLDELTSYIVAWKKEKTIPQSYVTQAELIWRKSGSYKYLTDRTEPPKCWEPITTIKSASVENGGEAPSESNLIIRSVGEDVLVLFLGLPGKEYTVETSTDLKQWTIADVVDANESGFIEWIDIKATASANRYYRVR